MERMKNEFISTVSHELRTPLTSIRGALALVLGKAADNLSPKARQLLETASRNSERLTLLINDILDLERIESGRLEFSFAPMDLVQAARQAIASNEGYAARHNVGLALGTAPEAAPITGDELRLAQVFANLVSNAIKYSPPESCVTLDITRQGRQWRVSVSDQGAAFPKPSAPGFSSASPKRTPRTPAPRAAPGWGSASPRPLSSVTTVISTTSARPPARPSFSPSPCRLKPSRRHRTATPITAC